MKIGDKVRFLNDVGGGVISGFQGKDTVLVCDEDGFEIPTLAKDVVVIETDYYNIAKVHTVTKKQGKAESAKAAPTSVKAALADHDDEAEEEETDLAEKELTYRPMAQERRGANELNLFLAFVPLDIKNVTDTAFEAYMVNDSNYYVYYTLLTCEGKACTLRHEGEVAPNTKIFLEEFRRDRLQEWERITVQTTAYKRDKSFLLKPALSIGLRIDGTKFYKLHTFQPNDFFNTPALVCDVIRDDRPARSLFVDAGELREAMQTPQNLKDDEEHIGGAERRVAKLSGKKQKKGNDILEVDLHAHELLDTMIGLAPKDILDYQLKVFADTMNAHAGERGRRIVFIHGKGDGVLRKSILKLLQRQYPAARYQDASFREYGFGATMVTIG